MDKVTVRSSCASCQKHRAKSHKTTKPKAKPEVKSQIKPQTKPVEASKPRYSFQPWY